MTQYRYIGTHAETLQSGAPIGPGEFVNLEEDDISGHTQTLFDDGKLIAVEETPAKKSSKTKEAES